MFTGIISAVGVVLDVRETSEGRRFRITSPWQDLTNGESISVSGACQTVEQHDDQGTFTIFSIPETLLATNFPLIREGMKVNLERAMTLQDRLGGHLVTGHVEGTAEVVSVREGETWDFELQYDSPYLIPKGSVTLDGISLTIQEVVNERFRVQIIPETLQRTTISDWRVGSRVNIETDYLVKAYAWVRSHHSGTNSPGHA